jgi:hypothetical protein
MDLVLVQPLRGRKHIRSKRTWKLDPAVAVQSPHDGDVGSNAVQPEELIHPFTLDCCLALQFHAQLDEERDCSREIL